MWSPDGRELLLETLFFSHTSAAGLTRYPLDESYPPQGVFAVQWGIFGQGVPREAGVRGVTWPDWSPDGIQIVYVGSVASHTTLRLINPDGSNDRPLTAPATDETDIDPAWSPDGPTVAFVQQVLAPDSIVTSVHAYVIDRDGANAPSGRVARRRFSPHQVCRWLALGVFGGRRHLRGQCGWQRVPRGQHPTYHSCAVAALNVHRLGQPASSGGSNRVETPGPRAFRRAPRPARR